MFKLSRLSAFAGNPIEEEDALAERLRMSGKKIVGLNRGDPAAYFKTPKYVVDAYMKALREGKTGYSFHAGIRPLREAIAKRHMRLYNLNTTADNVVVTQGVSESLLFMTSLFTDVGDSAILFRPYYPLYLDALELNGGKAIYVDCKEENEFRIDPDDLRKTLKSRREKRIKYMIFANPSNPTGSVLKRNELREIAEIAMDNDIFIVSDEIYDEIVYNGAKFTSISEVAEGIPYAIFGGASKVFDSTGFRMGYTIVPGHDKYSVMVRDKIGDYAKMRLSSSTPAEYAFTEAINNTSMHKSTMGNMIRQIEKRTNFAHKIVNESNYLYAAKPKGAFYLLAKIDMKKLRFKDDRELVRKLLVEEGVQVTRGSGFGAPGHMRIVTLATEDILEHAIRKIDKFLVKHSR